MNVHRILFCRLFLLIGLFITFFTSITLLAWQEYLTYGVPDPNHPFFHPHSLASGDPRHLDGKFQHGPNGKWPPVLSVYMEAPSSTDIWYNDPSSQKPKPKAPLPTRHTNRQALTRLTFPSMKYSSIDTTSKICNRIPSLLPIDDFGSTIRDPYLPWIHDLFISHDGKDVNVIAQNRRRCHKGKHHNEDLKFWEG